jgi:hypothetical protein
MPSENVPFAIVKALKLVVSKSEKGDYWETINSFL